MSGLAYLSSGVPTSLDISPELLKKIELGEHMDLILQGLCRASVRGSDDNGCKPCNAYIIASKASGILKALPTVFPGCKVTDWKALPTRSRGKVAAAIAMLEEFHRAATDGVLLFSDLMDQLGITNRSNFNKTIRNHAAFREAVDRLGVIEEAVGDGRHRNAFRVLFGHDPDATYVNDD